MKRILLAAGLGLGVLTATMAGTSNETVSFDQLKNDTVPTDTTQPTPAPDTSSVQVK